MKIQFSETLSKIRLSSLNTAEENRLVHAGQFMSGRVMSTNDKPERNGLNIITLNPNIFSDIFQIKSITNDLYLAISSAVNRAFKTKTLKISIYLWFVIFIFGPKLKPEVIRL